MVRHILITITIFLTASRFVYGSRQVADTLFSGNDTFYLISQPLEALYEGNRPDSVFGRGGTHCWRGYIATWRIKDSILYLEKVQSSHFVNPITFDLYKLIDRKYFTGNKVKAAWVSYDMQATTGIYIVWHRKPFAMRKINVLFSIEKGKLTKTTFFNNEKMRYNTLYVSNTDSFHHFIFSNINWQFVPNLSEGLTISFYLIPDETGKINSVIYRASIPRVDSLFFEELKITIKSLPAWDCYYYYDEFEKDMFWFRSITFTEEIRKKYTTAVH